MRKFFLATLVASLIAGFLASFLNVSQISGKSMEPTLHDKQLIILSRNAGNLERADIVFYHPLTRDQKDVDNSQVFVGRIVALPHEQYRVQKGSVYLKTESTYKLIEEYLPQNTTTPNTVSDYWFPLQESQYLVWGDNRASIQNNNSPEHVVSRGQIFGKLVWKF
ncbi:MAG: signal peptidase I [Candidatus Blackburnbacteria bacterium]|nr:signal peptidase I [Candidatus Blackburnbacteria bacterium]